MTPSLALVLALSAGPLPPDTAAARWAPPAPVPLEARLQPPPARTAAPGARNGAPRDRFFGEDKWKHFFTSFLATSLAAGAARAAGLDTDASVLVGAGAATALGIGKELVDHRGPGGASAYDLVWDLGGVGAAAAIVLRTQ